jgi:hypothetical protein
MPRKRLTLFYFLFSFSVFCSGQVLEPVIKLKRESRHEINTAVRKVTAVAVVADQPCIATVLVDGQTYVLQRDTDAPDFTYFLSLPLMTEASSLQVNVSSDNADVFLINSGLPPAIAAPEQSTADDVCTEAPSMILQSEWRSGLDAPNYSRSFHNVEHIIVHHSAGSNSATNFTQVVRDIYLYHTQVNGWSDIGYNYLISQDGTLYAGRDPGTGAQSLVRGAHFCGANTGTMGICLLGNFETAEPTIESLSTINDLLTFETISLNLDPLGEREHSTGLLDRIAGHRDGCATLCPGENVYSRLANIRSEVFAAKVQCEGGQVLDFAFNHEILGVDQVLTLTNHSRGYSEYQWWVEEEGYDIEQTTFSFETPGTYDLGLIGHTSTSSDTLLFPNAVKVSWLYQDPIIFPNPNANRVITIDYRPEIEKIVLRDLNGKVIFEQLYNGAEIEIPTSINGGIYQLELFTTDNAVKASKLVLQ